MYTHVQPAKQFAAARLESHVLFFWMVLDVPILITGDELTGEEPEVRKAKEPCKQNPAHGRQ